MTCCLSRGRRAAPLLGLLALAFAQLYGKKRSCRRPSATSVALLWIAVALVLTILLFPQWVASVLAW